MPTSKSTDIDKHFFNRKKDLTFIKTQLSMLEEDIPPQLLITGYRGVGKTFLLRKVLHDLPESYLYVILNLSELSKTVKTDYPKKNF